MVLIAVLIKRDQKIGLITRRKHFAGTDTDLEDGRAAGDGGWNCHVSHDVLIAASGEPGEKRAGGLDSVLRIAGEADDGVLNIFRAKIGPVRRRSRSHGGGIGFLHRGYIRIYRFAHGISRSYATIKVTDQALGSSAGLEIRDHRSPVRSHMSQRRELTADL